MKLQVWKTNLIQFGFFRFVVSKKKSWPHMHKREREREVKTRNKATVSVMPWFGTNAVNNILKGTFILKE